MAYAMKRRAQKSRGYMEEEKASGYEPHEGNEMRPNEMAMDEDDKDLGQHGEEEEGPFGAYAKGGDVNSDDLDRYGAEEVDFKPLPQNMKHGPDVGDEDSADLFSKTHDQIRENMPDYFAMGGSMVDRIMKKRGYSKGGRVANDTGNTADFKPNEFDDLALRDDLEGGYDGANSGDELGNAQEDEDRRDIVSRIMRSRAKRDRMPRPA